MVCLAQQQLDSARWLISTVGNMTAVWASASVQAKMLLTCRTISKQGAQVGTGAIYKLGNRNRLIVDQQLVWLGCLKGRVGSHVLKGMPQQALCSTVCASLYAAQQGLVQEGRRVRRLEA